MLTFLNKGLPGWGIKGAEDSCVSSSGLLIFKNNMLIFESSLKEIFWGCFGKRICLEESFLSLVRSGFVYAGSQCQNPRAQLTTFVFENLCWSWLVLGVKVKNTDTKPECVGLLPVTAPACCQRGCPGTSKGWRHCLSRSRLAVDGSVEFLTHCIWSQI